MDFKPIKNISVPTLKKKALNIFKQKQSFYVCVQNKSKQTEKGGVNRDESLPLIS
jgi:hypothetical protein